MGKVKYSLRYLPLFYQDLKEKVIYISEELNNPEAANHLLDEVEKAIINRVPNAESFEVFQSERERQYPYYRIYVKNYVVYYVVIPISDDEKIVEIRRFLYKKQNRRRII